MPFPLFGTTLAYRATIKPTDQLIVGDLDLDPTGMTGARVPVTSFVYKNAAGNVGIDTSSPTTKLSLGPGIGRKFSVYDASNINSGLGVDMSGGSYELSIYSGFAGGNGTISFGGYNTTSDTYTERMRITSDGGLILGRSSMFGGFGNETETGFGMAGGINGYMAINVAGSNGALYISRRSSASGIIASFATELTQTGSITTNGTTTTYNTTSDYRLKSEISDLDGSGEFIDALKPCKWLWTQNGEQGIGFIAHEFAEVSPSSVNGEKDAMTIRTVVDEKSGKEKTIKVPDYQSMQASSPEVMAHIIAEMQSLRKRIAELEANQ